MPMVPIWKNGQFLGTQWIAPKRKPLPPLTGGRGLPPGGGGYFPKPGRSWGVRGGRDPYLVDRMVAFPKTNVVGDGGGTMPPVTTTPPPPTTTTPPAVGSPATDGATAAAGDPWQKYLDELDRREKAGYLERIKAQQESARNYMEALQGFGLALQGNAADQWGNIIKAYGRAGDTTTAYQQGLASDYGQGLMDANRQIAQDFAAIGQTGAPAIRDDAAALAQVESVGGTRPGETTGLVGRAWGSYGETRPGTIGFMTGQNQMQVEREALQTERELHSEMQQALADNPQQAMQMWGAYEEWKNAKTEAEAKKAQAELDNKLAAAKEAREERALGLQESTIQRQWAQALEDMAWNRTNATGTLWEVRNGKLVNTGRRAPGSAAGRAATQAATTRRGQTMTAAAKAASLAETRAHHQATEGIANAQLGISQQQADTARNRAGTYARWTEWKKKHPNATGAGPGGWSQATIKDWRAQAGSAARSGFYGVKNPKYQPDPDKPGYSPQQWVRQPMKASEVMRDLISAQIPFQIAVKAIQAYGRAPNSRWKGVEKWTKTKKKKK